MDIQYQFNVMSGSNALPQSLGIDIHRTTLQVFAVCIDCYATGIFY